MVFLILTSQFALNLAWLWKRNTSFRPSSFAEFGIYKQVIGNLDSIERDSNSVLPHVRSDHKHYHKQGDPGLEYLDRLII